MAVLYSAKAGQWAKGEAKRITQTVLLWIVGAGLCSSVLFAYFAGLLLGQLPHLTWIALLVVAVTGIAFVWALNRWADRHFEAAHRERIKHLRGGQTEALVSMYLRDLSHEWHLFDNVKLSPQSDIDHILVGPGGLFAISTKSQRGLLELRDDAHLLNGESVDFAAAVKKQAQRFNEQLLVTLDRSEWVQPVLVVPFAFVRDERSDRSQVSVLHEDELVAHFENRQSRRFDRNRVFAIAAAVEKLVALRQTSSL